MEIQLRSFFLHNFHHFLTLKPIGYRRLTKVTLLKPRFWSKNQGFSHQNCPKINKNCTISNRKMVLEPQDFAFCKNDLFFSILNKLFFHIKMYPWNLQSHFRPVCPPPLHCYMGRHKFETLRLGYCMAMYGSMPSNP